MKNAKESMKVKRVLSKAPMQPKIFRQERMIFYVNIILGATSSVVAFLETEDIFRSFIFGLVVFVALYILTRYIWCVITLRIFHNDAYYEYFESMAESHEKRMDELKYDSNKQIESFWYFIFLIIPLIFGGIKRLFLAIVEFFKRYIIVFKVISINRKYHKDRRVVRKKYNKSTLYTIDNVPSNGVYQAYGEEIEIDIDKRRIRGKTYVSGENGKYEEVYIDNCKSMKIKVDHGVYIRMMDESRKRGERKVEFLVPYDVSMNDDVYDVKSFPAKETYELVMLLKRLFSKKVRISGSKRKICRGYKREGMFYLEGEDCMFKSQPRG